MSRLGIFIEILAVLFILGLLSVMVYRSLLYRKVQALIEKNIEKEIPSLIPFVCKIVDNVKRNFYKKYGFQPDKKELIKEIERLLSNYNYLSDESAGEFIYQIRRLFNKWELLAEREIFGEKMDVIDELEKEEIIERIAVKIATDLIDECEKTGKETDKRELPSIKVMDKI